MLDDVNVEYRNGTNDANAKQRATIGLYHTQANPMTRRLSDMETDIVRESMAITPHRYEEFWIIVVRMLARQLAAMKMTSHPSPL